MIILKKSPEILFLSKYFQEKELEQFINETEKIIKIIKKQDNKEIDSMYLGMIMGGITSENYPEIDKNELCALYVSAIEYLKNTG